MKAFQKNARISPKKMNLVAGMVRGMKANDALTQLKFTPKKAAHLLYKLIKSAVANATNNRNQKAEDLVVKSILVTKGITYKRGIPVSRGRYHPILKRNTNVAVEVAVEQPAKEEKAAKKTSKKAAPKKAAKKDEAKAEKKDTAKAETPEKTEAKKAAPKKTEKKDDKK